MRAREAKRGGRQGFASTAPTSTGVIPGAGHPFVTSAIYTPRVPITGKRKSTDTPTTPPTGGRAEPASEPGDSLRERLIAEATERLRTRLPSEMSLRELAASCGTSTNAIYSLFNGKPGLLSAVAETALEGFVTHQQAHADAGGFEALIAMGRYYRQWALENPALYMLIYGGHSEAGVSFDSGDRRLEPLRATVRALIEAGLLQPFDEDAVALSAWATLHGFVVLELHRMRQPAFGERADEFYAFTMQRFLAGMVTPEGGRQLAAAHQRLG